MDPKLIELHQKAGLVCGREHTCGKKVNYKSEESATKASEGFMKKGKAKYELEAYHCPFCGGWHIGRKMSLAELKSLAKQHQG